MKTKAINKFGEPSGRMYHRDMSGKAALRASRRSAVAQLFGSYDQGLRDIASTGVLYEPEPTDDRKAEVARLADRTDLNDRIRCVLVGKMVADVISARSTLEGDESAISAYATALIERWRQLGEELVSGFSLVFHPSTGTVLDKLTHAAAHCLFDQLRADAQILGDRFDETEYWEDAFRGVGDVGDVWTARALSATILDHTAAYRAAVEADSMPAPAPVTTH